MDRQCCPHGTYSLNSPIDGMSAIGETLPCGGYGPASAPACRFKTALMGPTLLQGLIEALATVSVLLDGLRPSPHARCLGGATILHRAMQLAQRGHTRTVKGLIKDAYLVGNANSWRRACGASSKSDFQFARCYLFTVSLGVVAALRQWLAQRRKMQPQMDASDAEICTTIGTP